MQLIFIHGWSVTNTNTYGKMPQALSRAAKAYDLDFKIQHIYLGRYISFHDEVTVDDISRAMDRALRDLPGNSEAKIAPFSCITHSTGGPVVRHWINKYYGASNLSKLPLKHLVMLAPANHGSSLAKLGKSRIGRIKSWFQGVEPGQKVLDWLCLGSDGQWSLNKEYLDYDYINNGLYPFVLTGQGIDKKFYDHLNSYLIEKGSDGVVRVAGANMNYRYFSLVQNKDKIIPKKSPVTCILEPEGFVKKPKPVAIGVYNNHSHSGTRMGIMRSVKENDIKVPIITDILKCFQVNNSAEYQIRSKELSQLTNEEQIKGDRYCMLIFNIRDDQGEQVSQDDYDLFLLAGNHYSPKQLPKGFFKDKQMNDKSGRLIYYLDADKMNKILNGKFGIRIIVRPSSGFSYYCAGEFHSDGIAIDSIIAPNETTYVDIKLHRFIDENVFRFDSANKATVNFKKIKPSGNSINNK
jgi:hypothetical protein